MSNDMMGPRSGAGAWLRLGAVLAIAVLALFALAATASAKSSTVWLCKPGLNARPVQGGPDDHGRLLHRRDAP